MSIDPHLVDMMQSTLQVQQMVGVDNYGEPSYSTAVSTFPCYITEKQKRVRNAMGEEVVSSHIVYVANTEGTLSATDLYTLSDGSQPAVITIENHRDETGEYHHSVVYFGAN